MSIILTFLAGIALIAGWWLSRQQLASKPWLEANGLSTRAAPPLIPVQKLGTAVFLAVIGGLFAMLGSAFVMQIEETPWQLVPVPSQVWLNTALLLLSSLALHFATRTAGQGRIRRTHVYLTAGAATALAFMFGQIQIWTTLTSNGYPLGAGPAASFFYLITGLHGLHILGGLVAMALVWLRLAQTKDPKAWQSPIALCALYWHGLLVVWLLLLTLLLGLANEFLALCRTVLT